MLRAGMEEFELEPFKDVVLEDAADRSQIQSLLEQFGEHVSPIPKVEFLGPEARDSRYSFVARRVSDRKIIGLAVAGPRQGRSPSTLYLDWILVDQAFRRQGLGDRLMQAVSDAGMDGRFHLLFWQTPVKNKPSQAFYDRLPGAERIGEVDVGPDRYVQYEKLLFREGTGPILAPEPDPRWEPFMFNPENAAETLGEGIRKLRRDENLLVSGLPRDADAYISYDGRVLFFRMGDTLTIQMNNPGKRSRLLIQEGTVWSEGRKRERRLEISLEKKGTRRVLFTESRPEADLSLIRGISYWGTEEGAELALILDRRVERVTPGTRWDRTVFSASTLIENGASEDEDVRISLRSEEEIAAPAPALPAATLKPVVAAVKPPVVIHWAGNLPLVHVVSGDPRPLQLSLDLNVPNLDREALSRSLELVLHMKANGATMDFPIPAEQMQFGEGWYGPYHNDYRVRIPVPEQVRPLLEEAGYVRFWFEHRLKGETGWKTTASEDKESKKNENGVGEIIVHPDWLFSTGVYGINAKAWGHFDRIRKRLLELKELGAKIILLQGIHPGGTAFEIEDFGGADPKLGGMKALTRLLREGRKMGFRFVIPFVPGHASPKNKLLQRHPDLFYQPKTRDPVAESQTVTVKVDGQETTFLRGNVFKEGRLPGELKDGFGPGTVQADLFDPAKRRKWADYWEKTLGKWVRLGVDGFYTDTGHSIHRVAPGWLEEIQRRIQMRHPQTIFGPEAHWLEAGGFLQRGASFAQEHSLYHDWIREVAYRRKSAGELMEHLRHIPPEILERMLNFIENHDENRIAYHLGLNQGLLPGLRADANRAFAALLVLGIPGIPLLNSGQEIGMTMKWEVTGNSYERDKAIREEADPKKLPPELFDPFADQSPEARELRGWCGRLLHLREGNRAFQRGEGTRFLVVGDDPHTFVSYRAAGNRRALVIVNLNGWVSSPDQTSSAVIDLSGLKLNPQEAANLRNALKQPSLQSVPDGALAWEADTQPDTLSYLKLRLKPFQTVVLEFDAAEVAAAGAEEPVFPVPVQSDQAAATEFWRDGGNVYPSGQLGTVAFVSPEDGKRGVGIYASLWNLDSENMVPEIFRLPGIPPDYQVYLYDDSGRVPSTTREKVGKILKEKGLEVVARVSGTRRGKDWVVPMIPIDAGAGLIRFEGWMPARPEFIGDYTVTVEVRWGESWYRLKQTGRFRVHPLDSKGPKLRVPEAREYKLWVSPTGQPVVIGWNPDWNFRSAPPQQVPIADQPYWIRFWGGRYYLLSRDQMITFGFSQNPSQPNIREGEPIVEAAIDMNHSGGIVTISDGKAFEDKAGMLGARLEKAFEVLGIHWHLQEFQPLPQGEAEERVQEMFGQLQRVGDTGSLRDFLVRLEAGDWERVSGVLRQVLPKERDRFLQLMHRSFDRWARRNPRASVFRVSSDPAPRSFHADGPPIVALSLNGVRDLIWRQQRDLQGRSVEQTLLPGGGPLAVARAAANLREGGEVDVVALGFGHSGERLFAGLRQAGFREEPEGKQTAQLIPVEGQENRVSVNGVVSSSPTVPAAYVRRAVEAVVEKMKGYGQVKGTLVIGEHLVRISDLDDPHGVAKALASLANAAKELGWKVAVAASSSWDKKTFDEILETQPDIFHIDVEPFARLVSSEQKKFTEEKLLYLPKEEVARLADQVRARYGVERFIVSLGAAGEILVTSSGWFSAVPSPDLELTYVTGERDVVLGVFLSLLQMGVPVKEALYEAVVAGVRHMEEWGRPVTEKEITANRHRASVYELLRAADSRPVSVVPAETPSYPEATLVPLGSGPKHKPFRTIEVKEGKAGYFARAAKQDSPIRVVIGPTAFQVEGMATILELLAGTALRDRFEVLPSEQVSYPQRISEMTALVRRFREVPNLLVVGHAADADPIMDEFVDFISVRGDKPGDERVLDFPFERQGLEALQRLVRKLLLNLGVPEGVATEKAVAEFLSAAGVEQNA